MNSLSQIYGIDGAMVLRISVAVPTIYLALIAFIRISGKRTTSQMNNFDWIVTVALGSLVATGILSSTTSVSSVLFAIALLLALQFAITWLTIRSARVREWVKPPPRLLFYGGQFLRKDMKAERVSELEVLAAIRAAGEESIENVLAVVLETDASLSVLPDRSEQSAPHTALQEVAVASEEVKGIHAHKSDYTTQRNQERGET